MAKAGSTEKVVREIRRHTRRRFSAEEKIRIVLEGLRGEESIAALCRREGLATRKSTSGATARTSLGWSPGSETNSPTATSLACSWRGSQPKQAKASKVAQQAFRLDCLRELKKIRLYPSFPNVVST